MEAARNYGYRLTALALLMVVTGGVWFLSTHPEDLRRLVSAMFNAAEGQPPESAAVQMKGPTGSQSPWPDADTVRSALRDGMIRSWQAAQGAAKSFATDQEESAALLHFYGSNAFHEIADYVSSFYPPPEIGGGCKGTACERCTTCGCTSGNCSCSGSDCNPRPVPESGTLPMIAGALLLFVSATARFRRRRAQAWRRAATDGCGGAQGSH